MDKQVSVGRMRFTHITHPSQTTSARKKVLRQSVNQETDNSDYRFKLASLALDGCGGDVSITMLKVRGSDDL